MVSQLPLFPQFVPLQHSTYYWYVPLESCYSCDSLKCPVPIVRGLLTSFGTVLPNHQPCLSSIVLHYSLGTHCRKYPTSLAASQLYSQTTHGSVGHSL